MYDEDDATGYKTCYLDPSGDAETYIEAADLGDDDYIGGWISAPGQEPDKLLKGVFDFYVTAEKTTGTETLRLYWKMFERKSDNSEVEIATSTNSNEITSKASYIIPLQLSSDYVPDSGSRIVGKFYADVSGSGNAPTVRIYYQGDTSSRWEIPANSEIFKNIFVPYSGAVQDVDLGAHSLTAAGASLDGAVVINESGADVDFRVEGDTEPNLLFVDAGNDRVGIGTNAPEQMLHVEGTIMVRPTSATAFVATVDSWCDFTFITYHDSAYPQMNLRRVRGTEASPSAVQSNDTLGQITGRGHDGIAKSNFQAALRFAATENWGVGSHGARVSLHTTPNGSTTMTERLRIDHDGGIFVYNLLSAAASTDVNINASNELHKVTSSKRFKKAVKPLEARFDSSLIYDLDPVSFVWRKNTGNPDMVDFGIIAEDAYEIMPELVNLDEEGKPFSVRYSMLPVMLLAEMQKLAKRVEALEHAN